MFDAYTVLLASIYASLVVRGDNVKGLACHAGAEVDT